MAADQPSQKQGKTTATAATSPNNATKKPKERVPVKEELTQINQYLMCSLCSGYLIDATSIIECQHTFCKSCILKYLETNGYCPICDIELNTVKPHLSLRSDVIVQRLVYKLVPGLLLSELRRRREYAESKDVVKAAESVSDTMALEVDAASDLSTILSLDDVVSLSIEYYRGTDAKDEPKPQPVQQKQDKLNHPPGTNIHHPIEDVNCSKDSPNDETNDRRYLKCPAAITISLLKKFIRMKYGLQNDYRVDLLYNGVRDKSLESDLTLLDVAFIFKWNKNEPMRFHYRIFDRTVKSLPTRAGKRTASSMMDEPPDDDAASGPHNRPPMTSASPSSKLPRVSNNSSTGANTNSGRTGGSARTTTTHYTSAPIYDFSEGNSDTEEPTLQTGKLKLRGFRRENNSASITANNSNSKNSNNNEASSKTGSQALKRSPSNLRSSVVENRRSSSSGKTASPARSNSVGTSHDDTSEDAESDSSSSESDSEAKTAQLTSTRVRSAAQTVLANQVNGAIKLNMTSSIAEKREPLRLALGSVTAKSPEHKHKHKHHHKMKHKKKHKPLKISLSLNPSSHAGRGNLNLSQKQKSEGVGGAAKITSSEKEKGSSNNKLISGQGQTKNMEGSCDGPSGSANSQSNFPVNVKPTTSAHLSNISKSISVSIGVGNNSNSSTPTANQSGKKGTTSTNLLSKKNSGIEVQPISAQATSSSNPSSNSNQFPTPSASRSHPLLPESVHVPKSVTLIPVNPSGMRSGGSVSDNVVGGGGGGGRSISSLSDKSGSSITTSNRMTNANTFTHSITNKSLHQIPNQITVTEVPPPPKSGSSSPASGGNSGGTNVGSATNNSGSNNSSSGPSTTNNPIEKVIAASHKPQFSGPGSMEITKIYCNTTKETPTTKKLKERKGLDISITVPGMSSMKDKKTHKLEETLRQKMGLNSSSTAMTMSNNKITAKGTNQTPVPLFNAKMPPGITIGPAGVTKSSISGNSNPSTAAAASNSGNTIAGLGFTLPPHITAHPQHPPAKQQQMIVVGNHQMKQGGDKSVPHKNLNISGPSKGPQIAAAANKERVPSGGGVTPKGLQSNKIFDNRKQLGEALASMMDMANRNALKSPSPPKNCQQTKEQHKSGGGTSKLHQPSINTSSEKRSIDMSSSSSASSRKNSRGSPEPKRSKTNESSSSSSSSVCNPKGSANESPLDLSGTGRTNSRPNSNSSSPIHHHSIVKTVHSNSSPSSQEKVKHSENMLHANNNMVPKKSPTPLPKVSPPSSLGKSSGNKGSGTPTGSSTSSISSIVQNLAQKQLSQQQHQKEQSSVHNQIMHLQQGLQNMHAASNLGGGNPHSHLQAGKGGSTLSSLLGNSLSPKGLNSISPPMTTMPNSSPPNTVFDPLRNLLTLSDAAVAARHGKVHPAMSLMSAVGLCPSPYSHHAGLSPTSVTSGSLFPQLASSLAAAAAAGGKSPGGMFDPTQAYLAAISAHNERLAAVAGMSQFHSDSMSPPMSMASSFSQVRPSSNSPHNHHHGGHGGLRIPPSSSPVQSKTGGSNNNYGKNSNNNNNNKQQGSSPTSPLSFSHPPPAPRSPSSSNKTANSSSVSQVSSSSSHSKSHDSLSSMKNTTATTATTTTTRINGTNTFFNNNHLPILPPGIHNPLLPTYPRSATTTNLVSSSSIRSQSPISSSSSSCITNNATAKFTSSSDKKGIPNSMKISNFLPSKPKGQDNSNVEATITSGSNVGGGASLTTFLSDISPPSILVTQAVQSNLSVSSATTLPKDVPSSRGFVSTLHNKSSNEQECLSKSDSKRSSPSSNVLSTSSTFFQHNPIKTEPAEKPIILSSSNIQLKSNADPITCPTNASTPNKPGLKMNEEMAKSNSLEIKSEGATTLMSSSYSGKGGQFGLGLSPPAARTTTSTSNQQPQNQAVRHIPNPALLFNRLNSSSASSLVTSPTSETPNAGKSLPFKSQKSPVKLEEVVALQVPALPFPGVSVPVKVDVDFLLSIPIPNTVKPILVQPTEHCGLKPLTNPVMDGSGETTEEKDDQTTTKKTEDTLLIAPSPNKEVDIKPELTAPLVSEQVKVVNQEEKTATNEISRSTKSEEEIVKIEYTTEDADLDIDIVGIETETPICPGSNDPATTFTPTESLQSQSEKEIEQKTTPNSVAVLESSEPLENIPSSSSSSQFVNEITAANTCDLNEPKKQDDKSPTPKYQHEHQSLKTDSLHIDVASTPSVVSPEETETEKILTEKQEFQLVCASEIEKITEVAKNENVPAEGVEEKRQDETEIRVVEETTEPTGGEVETNLNGMELEQQQPTVVELVVVAELLGKSEDEKSGESGEMTGESVEMVDTEAAAAADGGVQVEKLQQLISSNKSAELQIEAMECEEEVSSSSLTESIENHCMETTEQEKLVVDDEILMEEDDADEEMCIDAKEDSNSEIVRESENDDLTMLGNTLDHKLSQGHEFPAATNSSVVAAPGIAVAQEQNLTISTGATTTTTAQEMAADNNINIVAVAVESSCENENADAIMSSDIQIQAENSLSSCSVPESNSTLNQISINPEVVVDMLDMNIMKSPRVEAAIQPTSSASTDSADEKEGTHTNTLPKNNNIDQELKEDDEAEKKKLMKSSSSSQLELNCPSADTNDIELSNPPVTIVANAEVQLSNSSSSISVGHVADHIESPADILSAGKNVEEDASKLTVEQCTSPSISYDVAEEPLVASSVENEKVEEICQNTAPVPMFNMEPTDEFAIGTSIAPVTHHKTDEESTAADPNVTTTQVVPDLCSSELPSQLDDGDVEMTEIEPQLVETAPISPVPAVTFSLDNSRLISATATITTTTAELSNNVMEASSMESPISSRNSLESPTSPEDNIKKIETLEQVAAGLFATNTMNNNNNKTINAPTCDIAINTTSASDMATV